MLEHHAAALMSPFSDDHHGGICSQFHYSEVLGMQCRPTVLNPCCFCSLVWVQTVLLSKGHVDGQKEVDGQQQVAEA